MIGQEYCYLFSYFTGNGEDGLHLAWSRDGHTWLPIGTESFLRPTVGSGIMRDPCICLGPDGVFHMAWTTGWWDSGIGLAHSSDLIEWSAQKYLPLHGNENARNCWAPEIFYDATADQFVIHWAATIPGRFPETQGTSEDDLNHRTFYVTTRDFESFSPEQILFDDGFSVIDSTLIERDGAFVLIVKDETLLPEAVKRLRVATAKSATGPYGHASVPFSPSWVEGPTALNVGGTVIVYYDEYTRQKYGAIASDDLITWRVISDEVSFPVGTKHGTALRVPSAIVERLLTRVA